MQAIFEQVAPRPDASFHSFVRAEPAFEFAWHYHPQCELTYIVQGRGTRFVGDDIEPYGPGDLVLLGPNLPHTWAGPATEGRLHRAVVVQFDADFLGGQFFQMPEMRRLGHMLDEARRGLCFELPANGEFSQVVGRLQALPTLDGDAQLVALLGILCDLSHMASVRSLASAGYQPSLRWREQQRIDKVCGYLHEHFTETIEQSKISRMLRMNPAAFSRFFKRATGRTMTAYVNELRLGLAARLLIETKLTVLEVCYRAGFNNAANFHRQFARFKRCSPGQFRRRYELAAAQQGVGT